MKIGDRVKVIDCDMSRQWGISGERGIVIDDKDPRGFILDGSIVVVKLNNKTSAICEAGIHVVYLELIEED